MKAGIKNLVVEAQLSRNWACTHCVCLSLRIVIRQICKKISYTYCPYMMFAIGDSTIILVFLFSLCSCASPIQFVDANTKVLLSIMSSLFLCFTYSILLKPTQSLYSIILQ